MNESQRASPEPESIPASYRIFCVGDPTIKEYSLYFLDHTYNGTINMIANAIQNRAVQVEIPVPKGKICPRCKKTSEDHTFTVLVIASKK